MRLQRSGRSWAPTARWEWPKFSVVEEGTAKALDPIFRDDVYHIVREALRNSFKHSEAQKIEAEITYGKRLLRVRIRDDGKGIDRKVLEVGERTGHWGLPGMRERAKRISGQLSVWSEPGAGTEVELSLPGSLVYESALRSCCFDGFAGMEREIRDRRSSRATFICG